MNEPRSPHAALLPDERPTVLRARDVSLQSILLAMLAVGVLVGLVFPTLVSSFVAIRAGDLVWFYAACVAAGIVVGLLTWGVAWLTLHRANRYLAHLAAYDALTDLPNRRQFLRLLSAEMMRSERLLQPLSLVMLDIDHFKRVNDAHGHPTGDRVLLSTATEIARASRAYDETCRVGGEEFAVILPNAGAREALSVAERMRSAVALIAHEGEPGVTVSAGVATCEGPGDSIRGLIGRADAALYAAKGDGRNCVRADPRAAATLRGNEA
jgi:diguanylate cyclase (GGDEF)-like protein